MSFAVVVPTVGRPSLERMLEALAASSGPWPDEILVIDDRRDGEPLTLPAIPSARVLRSGGRGPAAARNRGWRAASAEWIAFLDDDVLPEPDWLERLAADLQVPKDVAGTQGRIRVPLPLDRRPTDWERNTAGLETAQWATADMAYRRSALVAVRGFDERFGRAYREDADLAARIKGRGWLLQKGSRGIVHPVRPADRWVSVRMQAGNADDVLMRRLHGPKWREIAEAPPGRRPRHLAVTAAAAGALLARRPPGLRAGLAAAWCAGTAEFLWARARSGPADPAELTTLALTTVAIPPAATYHFLRGLVRHRGARPWQGHPELVLFDRDDTLIRDVPYNGDPRLVTPMPGALEAVQRIRDAGIRTGVITNQSGIARGLLTPEQVAAVNARVEELFGPFDLWQVCPHGPEDGCDCRKPAPGMVKRACAELGVEPAACLVIGDIGADVEAASAAGAHAILVPTDRTRPEEVRAAPMRAREIGRAVQAALRGQW